MSYTSMENNIGRAAYVVDITSIGLVLGTLSQILPPIAAFLSIIWMAIRIYETCTVQEFLYGKDCEPGHNDE